MKNIFYPSLYIFSIALLVPSIMSINLMWAAGKAVSHVPVSFNPTLELLVMLTPNLDC
jgi:hypothetical protein